MSSARCAIIGLGCLAITLPDPQAGRIIGPVSGHSNTRDYFRAFAQHLNTRADELNPRFELLSAAIGGKQLPQIRGFGGPGLGPGEPKALAATPSSPLPATRPAAASRPGGEKAVAELMEQLGHRDYQRREAATRRLIEIGEPARPMLEARTTQPDLDPEVAERIKAVLKAIGRVTVKLSDKVSMEFVRIPSGKFLMGSPETEKGRFDNEGPQHEVTISKPFYLGVYEVTQEQFEAVMGKNPSKFKGAQNPVETVTWDDSVEFCKKASEKTGKKFRLPTEAEWEYACRARTRTRFNFGDDEKDLDRHAWLAENSKLTSHRVGQKKPNAFGLYDMHGNVFEWCADWHAPYADVEGKDPTGPATGAHRVVRGDSWGNGRPGCGSAGRNFKELGGLSSGIGFRVVVESR